MFSGNKLVKSWFRKVIVLLLVMCSIYLLLHFFHKGEVYYKLTSTDITTINLLLNNLSIAEDTSFIKELSAVDTSVNRNIKKGKSIKAIQNGLKLTGETTRKDSLKKMVLTYVFLNYQPVSPKDSLQTADYLMKFDQQTFAVIVGQHPFRCKSFFWLTNGWVYLEILFWSIFGLICSLLYNVSESVKKKKFDVNEEPVHLAKLLYTPFVALIIYLAMDILTLDKEINVSQYGNGLIVFAFILGYFSRRAIELLDKIKEILLPGKKEEENPESETKVEIASPEIIEEAIKEKGENWVNSFPNVTGFSIRNKISNNTDTGECALLFKVIKKINPKEFGQIPKYLYYDRVVDGRRYKILTDVLEESIPKPNIAKKDDPPFELGISVSREHDYETGTIGLLLRKIGNVDKKYIISCYHVLCAPELRMNNKRFSTNNQNCLVRCASYEDDGTNNIGWVLIGLIDSESDFAIAELNDNIQFENRLHIPFNNPITPQGFNSVIREDKNKRVKMCGRTSEYQEGIIKSYYSAQTIDYGNNINQYMKGLVEINPISKGGDSGAAVFFSDTNRVIGLVVCGNEESTYVLPVFNFIDNNEYKLI